MPEPASAPTSAALVDEIIETAQSEGGERRDALWRGSEDALAQSWRLGNQLETQRIALLARLAAYDALAAAARKVRASGRLGSMAFDDAILGVDGFPDLMKALAALDGEESE